MLRFLYPWGVERKHTTCYRAFGGILIRDSGEWLWEPFVGTLLTTMASPRQINNRLLFSIIA